MAAWPFRGKKSEDTSQLSSLLTFAQSGDDMARQDILESYTPFVLKVASQASRRYIDRHRDDEFSVALIALNEAIDRFEPERNTHFLGFAETIIRRRLIDYFRSQGAYQRQVPMSEFDITDEEDNVVNYVEVQSALDAHQKREEAATRVDEIRAYAQVLGLYGLSFDDLVAASPKHADARESAIAVARTIIRYPEMVRYVMEKKALPLKQVEAHVGVSRKTLDRQRKYILAVVLLLNGDYQHLQSYVGS